MAHCRSVSESKRARKKYWLKFLPSKRKMPVGVSIYRTSRDPRHCPGTFSMPSVSHPAVDALPWPSRTLMPIKFGAIFKRRDLQKFRKYPNIPNLVLVTSEGSKYLSIVFVGSSYPSGAILGLLHCLRLELSVWTKVLGGN